MAGDPSRPPWRDAALVALLAVVLVAGLVYYGVRLSQEPASAPAAVGSPSAAPVTPSTPESVEPTPGPSPSAVPPVLHPGTCWDDTETPDVGQCSLPTGVAGLEYVFPSFRSERSQCRQNPNTDRSFGVELSWVCTERALGREVLVSYDQVTDIDEVDAFMHASVPAGQVVEIPGANGGRCVATDTAKRPARITGWYERFPYVVSVFAPTRASAERAWKAIVQQRPAQTVRGKRA